MVTSAPGVAYRIAGRLISRGISYKSSRRHPPEAPGADIRSQGFHLNRDGCTIDGRPSE